MPIPPVCPSCSACSITQINVCCFPSLLLRSPSKRARILSFMTRPAPASQQLFLLRPIPPVPTTVPITVPITSLLSERPAVPRQMEVVPKHLSHNQLESLPLPLVSHSAMLTRLVSPSFSEWQTMPMNACFILLPHRQSQHKPAPTSLLTIKPVLQFLLLFLPLPTLKVLLLAPLHREVLGTLAALAALA